MKNKIKYLFIVQIIIGILLSIVFLKGCIDKDYNWSKKTLVIQGTVKTTPEIHRGAKSGSNIVFEINELPVLFSSPGYEYYDYVDKNLVGELHIKDSIVITVLEYDYKNQYLEKKNAFHLMKPSLHFYSLLYNGKQYVDSKAFNIDPPNYFLEFIIKFAICALIIIVGFYKLIDI